MKHGPVYYNSIRFEGRQIGSTNNALSCKSLKLFLSRDFRCEQCWTRILCSV